MGVVSGERHDMKNEAKPPAGKDEEIVVLSVGRASRCAGCGAELLQGGFLRMEKDRPLCLACAGLDGLVFLGRGDAALTRRSRKYSAVSAVVVRFSRSRGRYERQGLLVEPAAVRRAEAECQADAAGRVKKRERAAIVREKQDRSYVAEFTVRLQAHYPGCPVAAADEIARHACARYSGRVGRSARPREFDPGAIALAVRAFLRHRHTDYDRLMSAGVDRAEARIIVATRIDEVESQWRNP